MIKSLYLILLLIPGLVSAECTYFEKQKSMLNQQESQILRKYGIVAGYSIDEKLPFIVIEDSLINNCEAKNLVSKYFVNKISGNNVFEINSSLFNTYNSDLSRAAYRAISESRIWSGGISHEIFNVVSDDLLPAWKKYVIKEINGGVLFPEVLTKSVFEQPDKDIYSAARATGKRTSLGKMSLLILIRYNYGENLSHEQIKTLLNDQSVYVFDLYNKDRKEIIDMLIELLKDNKRIRFNQMLDFYYSFADVV